MNIQLNDVEKHVLEQAKIEVDHTRSWPPKILAFYVAINLSLVASVVGLSSRTAKPIQIPPCCKVLVTLALAVFSFWAGYLLVKNHRSYLRHRNVQIQF